LARMHTLAALLLLASPLYAQDHPDPPPRPAPKPIAPKSAPPRDDSIPGLEDADFRIAPAPLRREGSFITRQRGSMLRLPGGDKAFIFHKDAQGRAERPMVLLPCLTLQSMEQILADRNDDTAFLITGQVYAYRGVNYLLPTAAPTASIAGIAKPESPNPHTPKLDPNPTPQPAQPPDKPSDKPTDKPADKPADKPNDPAVQDLIRDLEAQRDRPRTLGGTPAPSTPKPAASTDLLPEGSTISLRRGRIVRLNGGEWAFAFDNAPTGDPDSDRALVLSPCQNLQGMESWAARLGDGATLLMSGRIYQYQGRNHIIPTMYQIATPAELSPRQ
jgi:hypothetical protein